MATDSDLQALFADVIAKNDALVNAAATSGAADVVLSQAQAADAAAKDAQASAQSALNGSIAAMEAALNSLQH